MKRFTNDMTLKLSEKFPGFSKTQLCFINNPKKYGVYLSKEAEQFLIDSGFSISKMYGKPNKSKKSVRKKNKSVSIRLKDEDYECMMKKVKEMGCKTIQEFMEQLIKENLNDVRYE